MPETETAFARRLSALSAEAGLTGNALAVRAGMSATYVRDLMRGAKAPSLEVAQRLAKVLSETLGECVTTADFEE